MTEYDHISKIHPQDLSFPLGSKCRHCLGILLTDVWYYCSVIWGKEAVNTAAVVSSLPFIFWLVPWPPVMRIMSERRSHAIYSCVTLFFNPARSLLRYARPMYSGLTPISKTPVITATIKPIFKLRDAIDSSHQKEHIAVENVSTFRCTACRLTRVEDSHLRSTRQAWLIHQRHSISDFMFLVAEEPRIEVCVRSVGHIAGCDMLKDTT